MVEKPIPAPCDDTDWFWKGCSEERFLIQKCLNCTENRFYPASICPDCHSRDWTTIEASGTGTVESMTVIHYAPSEAFEADVPYILALIRLDEGVQVMANIVECQPKDVEIGDEVEMTWVKRGDQLLYQFTLN